MNYVFDLARHGRLWIARALRLIIIVDLLRGDLPKVPKERASESRDGCRDCRLRWRRWRRRRRSEASVSTTKKHLRAAVATVAASLARAKRHHKQSPGRETTTTYRECVRGRERERERERESHFAWFSLIGTRGDPLRTLRPHQKYPLYLKGGAKLYQTSCFKDSTSRQKLEMQRNSCTAI